MSILSQIGVVILIGCIIFILIRSNKTLEDVSREGEHFVDEWDMRQQKKEERLLEREERKAQKAKLLQEKKEQRKNREQEQLFEEKYEDIEEEQTTSALPDEAGSEIAHAETADNIISMEQYRNTGVTLVELNERHQPVRSVRVTKLPFTIGRSAENMLVLDDLCVARKHCRIVEKDGVFVLEDVGTANKLYVNGAVTDRAVLTDRLTLYIGNVEFRVQMETAERRHTQLYQKAGERYYE